VTFGGLPEEESPGPGVRRGGEVRRGHPALHRLHAYGEAANVMLDAIERAYEADGHPEGVSVRSSRPRTLRAR